MNTKKLKMSFLLGLSGILLSANCLAVPGIQIQSAEKETEALPLQIETLEYAQEDEGPQKAALPLVSFAICAVAAYGGFTAASESTELTKELIRLVKDPTQVQGITSGENALKGSLLITGALGASVALKFITADPMFGRISTIGGPATLSCAVVGAAINIGGQLINGFSGKVQ